MTFRVRSLCASVAVAVALSMVTRAQSPATPAQSPPPSMDQQMLNELRQIRLLLQRLVTQSPPGPTARPAGPPPDRPVKLTQVSGEALGSPDAPLMMVEFTDLQCPYCRQFFTTSFDQLKKDYIDTGKLRYVTRDLPIDQLHPLATTAARANRCAGEQGRFWEMRHTILVNNATLKPDVFSQFARDLELDMARFDTCIGDSTRFSDALKRDHDDAASVGISGTPSFVIGRAVAGGVDGVLVVGARPYAMFDAKLKELLASPTVKP